MNDRSSWTSHWRVRYLHPDIDVERHTSHMDAVSFSPFKQEFDESSPEPTQVAISKDHQQCGHEKHSDFTGQR